MLKTNAVPYVPEISGETNVTIINKPNVAADKQKSKTAEIEHFLQHMPDVVCLSHLRWDFVYQRPQHLLSRFARHSRLFFVEEPVFTDTKDPSFSIIAKGGNIHVVTPQLPHGFPASEVEEAQRALLNSLFREHLVEHYLFWYYTPMALSFTAHFKPVLTIYDCMDELSAFKFAPPRLKELEQQLFQKADLVFTGGHTLYEAKRKQHTHVHPFPSSIDKAHFAQARNHLAQPEDQASIPAPRIGFFGVVDERMDLEMLAYVAKARPGWHLVIVGPVVKIDPAALPQGENIHYLGGKSYQELPAYVSGWDVALLPFAINESTEFISPTKTPEYLAAGRPVVSTPIRDVIRPYGDAGLVQIAQTPEQFVEAIERAMAQATDEVWQQKADTFLAGISWDQTWRGMVELMSKTLHQQEK